MRILRTILRSRIFTFGLAILLISAAILVVGELLILGTWQPFGTLLSQLVVIGVLVAFWLAYIGIVVWRTRRKNTKLVNEIAEPEIDPSAEAITAEEKALQHKFSEALKSLAKLKLKSRFGGSRYVYQLPWYVLIGPPGSGKTTALENCGLDFPLRKAGGDISIDGGSGTRNCDWVFTNEAVFIDTAGRYTTQEDGVIDSSAWNRFIDLLIKHRPSEPVNGVIVCIPISDLALASPAEIDIHAASVRARINELTKKMKAYLPVYVMFTKADQVIGFNEFFQTLRKSEREQVWGTTFPLVAGLSRDQRAKEDLGTVDEEHDRLLGRLGAIQFRHIQEEPDLGVRARIFGFSSQFSSLKPVVTRFLHETFKPDEFSETPLLRGFYFTSATQIGQPVDRLLATMEREFGLERRAVGVAQMDTGRAYFLEGLLRRVIFSESGLVTGKRQNKIFGSIGKLAALSACVLLPIALGLGWFMVHSHTEDQATQFQTVLADYRADLADIEVSPVADDDLISVLPPLNRLRSELERLESDAAEPPLAGLALNDIETIRSQARFAYAKALDDLFRPRVLFRLEKQLSENLHRPEPLYEILKAYLMVGGRSPLDGDYVTDFVMFDWRQSRYPEATNREELPQLAAHLEAMLAFEPDDRDLDDEAIVEARAAISHVSVAERALRLILRSPQAREIRGWSVASSAPRLAEKVFHRRSGLPLETKIDGIFTYEGFHQVFKHNVSGAAVQAIEESWIVSSTSDERELTRAEATRLREDIYSLYYRRYAEKWNAVLEDVRIVPFTSAAHAAETLNYLSSGNSPLTALLSDVSHHTALAVEPLAESEAVAGGLREATTIGWHIASSRANKFTRVFKAISSGETTAEPEGMTVQKQFGQLSEFVGNQKSPGELEDVIDGMRELYNDVRDIAQSGASSLTVVSDQNAAKRISSIVRRSAPIPVATIITDMMTNAGDTTNIGILSSLNEIWKSTVYQECRRRVHNRYPFGNGEDIAIGDFAAVLGPGGIIDKYYSERLKYLVDDSVKPWRWEKNIGIPAERLSFFETAEEIKRAFFGDGGRRPNLRLSVFNHSMSPTVSSAKLSVGGAEAKFIQGKRGGAEIQWPGPQPALGAEASIILDEGDVLSEAGTTDILVGELGDWGLFHLIDKADVRVRGAGDKIRAGIGGGGHRFELELRLDNAINPLALRATMKGFRCPARL